MFIYRVSRIYSTDTTAHSCTRFLICRHDGRRVSLYLGHVCTKTLVWLRIWLTLTSPSVGKNNQCAPLLLLQQQQLMENPPKSSLAHIKKSRNFHHLPPRVRAVRSNLHRAGQRCLRDSFAPADHIPLEMNWRTGELSEHTLVSGEKKIV